MNKSAKIVVGIMIALIAIYIIVAIYKGNLPTENSDTVLSGDVSGDLDNSISSNIIYSLESGDNIISLTAASSGEKSITNYIFQDDRLSEIIVVEEIYSGDMVNGVFESIKNNSNINQIYSSIELQENSIVMKLKDEFVASFGEKNMADIFDEMNQSMILDKENQDV